MDLNRLVEKYRDGDVDAIHGTSTLNIRAYLDAINHSDINVASERTNVRSDIDELLMLLMVLTVLAILVLIGLIVGCCV